MRFMLIVKASKDSEAGVMPSGELIAAMCKFNEEMAKAGVLLAGDGLQASSKGARVRFSQGKRTVIDGPFAETKELIAGFWLIQVKSREEAIEWAKRSPAPHENQDCEIEVRQVFEATDFPADVLPPDAAAREEALRDELQKKAAKR
ncbi:MAG TPA: YciI family protein [Candidatus Acidoferrum sp.]